MLAYSLAFFLFTAINYSFISKIIEKSGAKTAEDLITTLLARGEMHKIQALQMAAYGIIVGISGTLIFLTVGLM